MKITPFIVTYNTMATGPELKRCAAYLLDNLPPDLGCAIEQVDLFPRCQTSDPIKQPLGEMYETFQENLKKLPYIRFRRKLKLLEVSYVSNFVYSSSMFGKEIVPLSLIEFNCLCREFSWALSLARQRLTKRDDFNIAALEKHLEVRLATLPNDA